ncbi:hypothetical protein AVEN_175129-1 [Araneus ventricosus]|uniref:Uncharacterized protein n=1 Tax=Araneus ventricosus TaxID=182803 RepID=A0A4Y2R139_ARAVE|nr:hypothetical protein AVEN_175129-1 [Araneus ventricosus]
MQALHLRRSERRTFLNTPGISRRRRKQQKSWKLGPRRSRWGFCRRDFSNGPTGKSPDWRDRVSVPSNVWAHPDQSIAMGIQRLKRSPDSKRKLV